jgi:hypothetical protein
MAEQPLTRSGSRPLVEETGTRVLALSPTEDAVRAYRERWGHEGRTGLTAAPPALLAVFWPLATLLFLGLAVGAFVEIPISAPGPGVFETSRPIRNVQSPVNGSVESLEARSGQVLEAGAALARLRPFTGAGTLAAAGASVVLRMPEGGQLESFYLSPGQVLVTGDRVGRVVPTETPTRIVALVSDRDRPSLSPAAAVRVQVDQLGPLGHFTARVDRIAAAPATAEDVVRVVGDKPGAAPGYLVELTLVEDARYQAARGVLHPGMKVSCSFPVRRVRLLSALFPPSGRTMP